MKILQRLITCMGIIEYLPAAIVEHVAEDIVQGNYLMRRNRHGKLLSGKLSVL
tara:strand:+ start:62 stop:220 length:159 start_codon:yes stop_codon:yes gene_type:complete